MATHRFPRITSHRTPGSPGADGRLHTASPCRGVCNAGALGSIGCATLSMAAVREQVAAIRQMTNLPILSSATTVAEARSLETRGADVVIAQGLEPGGHRGSFSDSPGAGLVGTMALVPQVVDAVRVPVIAAGGIADGQG